MSPLSLKHISSNWICFTCNGVPFIWSMSITTSSSCVVVVHVFGSESGLGRLHSHVWSPPCISVYTHTLPGAKLIAAFWLLPAEGCLFSLPRGPALVCGLWQRCSVCQTDIGEMSWGQKWWPVPPSLAENNPFFHWSGWSESLVCWVWGIHFVCHWMNPFVVNSIAQVPHVPPRHIYLFSNTDQQCTTFQPSSNL